MPFCELKDLYLEKERNNYRVCAVKDFKGKCPYDKIEMVDIDGDGWTYPVCLTKGRVTKEEKKRSLQKRAKEERILSQENDL